MSVPDGGWKLSSPYDNSCLSKIYLCQFVARAVLGRAPDPRADAAHRAWLLHPRNTHQAWSDQMVPGVAKGSRYHPRGVTAWLWTESAFTDAGAVSAVRSEAKKAPRR